MQRSTELKAVGIGVIVLVALAVGVGFIFGNAAPAKPSFTSTTVPPLSGGDHVRGDARSAVSVVEYGDFECPACAAYEPIVEQLTRQYGDKVAFAFRNFPLTQIHQNAMISAQAAEAAALQGKYWEMHDLIYQKQAEWSNESPSTVASKYFDVYARQLGLDVAKFDADINSDAVKSKIQEDISTGTAAQVDHTPTFFIDLTQIPNPQSAQEFDQDIQKALSDSGAAANATSAAATSTQ